VIQISKFESTPSTLSPAESSEDIQKLIPKEFDLYQLAKLNEEQLEKGLENFWIDTLLNKDTKLRT